MQFLWNNDLAIIYYGVVCTLTISETTESPFYFSKRETVLLTEVEIVMSDYCVVDSMYTGNAVN